MRFRERLPENLVAFGATTLYVLTASRWLVGRSDAAEFAAVGANGGVAHPPGYPLFVLWLRLFAWLPTNPAHRAALATALLGGISIALMQWACRSWGASRGAAAIASAVYALSPLAWEQATAPEVFVGNVAIAMAIVAVSGPDALPGLRGAQRVGLLGLFAGLGLSNQHTIVLLAPLGLYAAICEARGQWARALAYGIGGLALGLAPYAYLPVATRYAPEACVLGNFRSVDAIVHHFLRAEYGTFKLSSSKAPPQPVANLRLYAQNLASSLVWLPLAAGLAFAKRRSWPSRGVLIALLLSLVLVGPGFVVRMNIPPTAVMIAERFHLLSLALITVVGAVALDGLFARFADDSRAVQLAGAATAVLSIARVAWVALATPWYSPVLEHYLANLYRTLPKDAVYFAGSDAVLGGLMYEQCTTAPRPDVVVVNPTHFFAPWYAERMARNAGIVYRPVNNTIYGMDLLDVMFATGRPVFLGDWFVDSLKTHVASYPLGPTIRVVQDPADVLEPRRLFLANEKLLESFTLEETRPAAGSWEMICYRDYVRPWSVLADAFESAHRPDIVAACREHQQLFAPRAD